MTTRSPRQHPGTKCNAGSGLFPSLFGAFVMLVFLIFATQLALGLYAGNAVQAAAFDAARKVAESPSDPQTSTADVETQLRSSLGSQGAAAQINWDLSDPVFISLSISTPRPHILPKDFIRPFASPNFTRTIRVRRETVHA